VITFAQKRMGADMPEEIRTTLIFLDLLFAALAVWNAWNWADSLDKCTYNMLREFVYIISIIVPVVGFGVLTKLLVQYRC